MSMRRFLAWRFVCAAILIAGAGSILAPRSYCAAGLESAGNTDGVLTWSIGNLFDDISLSVFVFSKQKEDTDAKYDKSVLR